MAKILYACSRRPFDADTTARLASVCKALKPDNLKTDLQTTVRCDGGVAYACTDASDALNERGLSVLLGALYEKDACSWEVPESPLPDGSYALFRTSPDMAEAATDPAGSRTIWYFMDEERFVASTSQRAIVMFLGSFEFDANVIPWMLSTGSLGPERSWDRRLRRIQPACSVILDRASWRLRDGARTPVVFEPADLTKAAYAASISAALDETIGTMRSLDWSDWVLPLSGGYDSRGILCLLKHRIGIPPEFRTITWGLEASLHQRGNDARVARDVARAVGVRHEYLTTDLSQEPVQDILSRFIACAEGRTDHLAGYADGMDIWRRLHDDRIRGIIRGDEGFGWVEVTSELGTRLSVEGALCSDFENLKHVPELLGLPPQEYPPFLRRSPGESLESWRDKLYHAYRIPTVLAALSDAKLSYVEQITPLLARRILEVIRRLPDGLRTEKNLYKEVVRRIGPSVPYATRGANADPRDILESPRVTDVIRSGLNDADARSILPPEIIQQALGGIAPASAGDTRAALAKRVKRAIAQRLPRFAKDLMRATVVKPTVGGNTLAFRAYVIIRMARLLADDSHRLRV